jgi:peroxiredoxin
MKYFPKKSVKSAIVFITSWLFCLSCSAQTTKPTPTFEEYAANFEARLQKSKIEKELNEEIAKLEDFMVQHPEQADYCRQQIVRKLIWLKAPTDRILKTVGNGFAKPEKGLYASISWFFADQGEQLETALKFLEMESKVIYIHRGNDAYSPPCLWCIESEIRFKQKDYRRVIAILEPITIKWSPQLRLFEGYNPPNLHILGNSYFNIGRIDDAIKIFLKIVSETYEPKIKDRKTLAKFYTAKHTNLNGLNEAIIENHRQWKYESFIKPYILNIPSPKWKLPDFKGEPVSLSEFSNKVVVLRFFTSQIRSIENRDYMQSIQALYEKYKNQGVVVIGIDESYPHPTDIRRQWFQEAFKGMNITFPILLDNRRELASQYGLAEQMTILIDKKGIIRFSTADLPMFTEQLDYFLSHLNEFR